jgi:hypothetical protein
VPDLIPLAEVAHLFDDFEHTAWRLETRRGYDSDRQTEEYQRFVRGEPSTEDLTDPYYTARRAQAAEGKRFERVRLVDDPPTEGQRYLLHRAQFNAAAGEDVRNLWRRDAVRLHLPPDDFWLFDSRTLVTLRFDDADRMLGVEVTEDHAAVVLACQARDAAWHFAIRYKEFRSRVPSTV